MTEPSPGRITLSEDRLDSKLARLELSLVDRITKALDVKADHTYVEQLHARIHAAEGAIQATTLLAADLRETATDTEKRIRYLEKFRFAIPSAATLSAIATVFSIYAYFHI